MSEPSGATEDAAHAQQTIKPIVSDLMTVSSKETLDSRDDIKEAPAPQQPEAIGADKPKPQPPAVAAPQGRYPHPQRPPFAGGRPPYAPPPPYYAAYGPSHHHPPPPHHHAHHPPQYMMYPPPPMHGQPPHPQYLQQRGGGGGGTMPPHPHNPYHYAMPPAAAPGVNHHHNPYGAATAGAGAGMRMNYPSAAPSGHHHGPSSAQAAAAGHGSGGNMSPGAVPSASSSSSMLGKKRTMEPMMPHTHDDDNNEGDHPMRSANSGGAEADSQRKHHRRNLSGDSTASSLSVGGYSFESYGDGPRVGAMEDHMMADIHVNSPKRRKGDRLMVDTSRPDSSCSQSMGTEKGFEQMSLSTAAGPKMPHSTSSDSSAGHGNLFLSLSTSPINHDADQTPLKKNITKNSEADKDATDITDGKGPDFIFKMQGAAGSDKPQISDSHSDLSRPTETPMPPASHGDLVLSTSLTEEHSMLNRHLRNQSFTPLPTSPSGAMTAPQLSWSIAGDTPSLGDLADWDDHGHKLKTDTKIRPGSATSVSSRHMTISPHDFQFWKEEQDMADVAMSGTTTPLPAFFEHGVKFGTESSGIRFDPSSAPPGKKQDGPFVGRNNGENKQQPSQQQSRKLNHEDSLVKSPSGLPPTPMFGSTEFRDDIHFGPRSPMGADRREGMDYGYPGYLHPMHHPSGPGYAQSHNDRVRNLRGRMMPGMHMPPMPLHIPPPVSSHLPMTSPMGLGPKAGLWSPHHLPPHHLHGGLPPALASPHHHLGSPLSNMAQSKRKCVPLKPPIPSKFQGDMDSAKSAPVPEFTSLVNFPAHMSQKQSVNLPEGMRCCVMCGQACQCTVGNKATKKCTKKIIDGSLGVRGSNGQECEKVGNGYAIIPSQNKGLCTMCDVNVWVVVSSGLEIKWCKGCKNMRPWAAFGEKGLATKCLRCRERQREKYALQKEEKEKARSCIKVKK